MQLSETPLFLGATEEQAREMLACLGSAQKAYAKGEAILRAGDAVKALGLVLSGSVNIEHDDVWGNRSILGHIEAGQVFAESYACLCDEPLLIGVTACEASEILFLDVSRMLAPCPGACAHHSLLLRNLLAISARKNISLSRRILHTSYKTIRGRLLSYLSEQAARAGSRSFTVPFNRQQLADYLGVERSALSNELSKMRRDGLIAFDRSRFVLHSENAND